MYDPTLNTTCITFINFEEFEPGEIYLIETQATNIIVINVYNNVFEVISSSISIYKQGDKYVFIRKNRILLNIRTNITKL